MPCMSVSVQSSLLVVKSLQPGDAIHLAFGANHCGGRLSSSHGKVASAVHGVNVVSHRLVIALAGCLYLLALFISCYHPNQSLRAAISAARAPGAASKRPVLYRKSPTYSVVNSSSVRLATVSFTRLYVAPVSMKSSTNIHRCPRVPSAGSQECEPSFGLRMMSACFPKEAASLGTTI